ncbi:hypothetical protein CBL_05045 [Carabus blaptoides fortunei]
MELENAYKENFEVDEITKKINNLRTQFLEVEKNRKKIIPSGSGADAKNVPSWWLYNDLLFLLPFCKRDKGISNLQISPESSSPPEANVEEFDYNWCSIAEEEEFNTSYVDMVEADITVPSTESLLSPSSVTDSERCTPTQPRKKKRKRVETEVDEAIAKAIERVGASPDKLPEDIQSFCDFVGHELLSIRNKKVLKQCKWEIQTIIHRKQEEDENM